MKTLGTIAALAMLAAFAGCASGDLTVDAMVSNVMHSVAYRLEPTGKLTVTEGGAIEGTEETPLYATQVDQAGMARFRNVVTASGFLLAEPPIRATMVEGPSLRLEVTLGLWHNTARLYGTRMASATKIVDELNRHLPAKYALKYNPPPPEKPDQDFEDFFR